MLICFEDDLLRRFIFSQILYLLYFILQEAVTAPLKISTNNRLSFFLKTKAATNSGVDQAYCVDDRYGEQRPWEYLSGVHHTRSVLRGRRGVERSNPFSQGDNGYNGSTGSTEHVFRSLSSIRSTIHKNKQTNILLCPRMFI